MVIRSRTYRYLVETTCGVGAAQLVSYNNEILNHKIVMAYTFRKFTRSCNATYEI